MNNIGQVLDWNTAAEHLRLVQKDVEKKRGFQDLSKITQINNLWKRFKRGERTEDLYDAMIGVE
jgi:hypothetical protein